MNRQAEAIGQDIEGIIALLLSLAVVAERACSAPSCVRAEILSLLWPVEQVARHYVFRALGPTSLPAHDRDTVDDAQDLALRFRLLAFALMGVAARLVAAWRRDHAAWPPGMVRDAGGVIGNTQAPALPLPQPFDTS